MRRLFFPRELLFCLSQENQLWRFLFLSWQCSFLLLLDCIRAVPPWCFSPGAGSRAPDVRSSCNHDFTLSTQWSELCKYLSQEFGFCCGRQLDLGMATFCFLCWLILPQTLNHAGSISKWDLNLALQGTVASLYSLHLSASFPAARAPGLPKADLLGNWLFLEKLSGDPPSPHSGFWTG